MPSFLADIVIPSASEPISWTISVTDRCACPGSRSLMNHAFSANRQPSRNSGLPYRSQTSRTARRLASETGCPPPELLVIVTTTSGTSAARSARSASSASVSMLPLNGWMSDGWRPSAMTRSRASAPECSTLARVVSKWVLLGMTLPGPPTAVYRIFSAARPWWVGMTWREREQVLDGLEEREPAGAAGVALVAALDRGPLVAAHRARAGVGQQVDQDVGRVEVEQVPARGLERRLALRLGGQPDRLDRVDPERLDDRLPAVHGGEDTRLRRPGPLRRSRPDGTLRACRLDHATSCSSG